MIAKVVQRYAIFESATLSESINGRSEALEAWTNAVTQVADLSTLFWYQTEYEFTHSVISQILNR